MGSLVVDKSKPWLLVYLHSNDEFDQAEAYETEEAARAEMMREEPTTVLYRQVARHVNEAKVIESVAAPPAAGSADRG